MDPGPHRALAHQAGARGAAAHPRRLNAAEAFETFLQTKYVGQKRFSLEGGESSSRCSTRSSTRRPSPAWTRSSSAWPTAAG
ncbi:hypothetical protein LV779_00555 [Streptomyces thinghirensis]|nr:hypothetical protein [Streptomyces thinghirensis]